MRGRNPLPPLPDGYYNDQIDEVSSARTSIIEKESEINIKANIKKETKSRVAPVKANQTFGYKKLNMNKPSGGSLLPSSVSEQGKNLKKDGSRDHSQDYQ